MDSPLSSILARKAKWRGIVSALMAAIAADAMLVAGLATAAIGIWLFVRDDDEDEDETDPTVQAWAAPTGAGVQVNGAF